MSINDANDFEKFLVEQGMTAQEAYNTTKLLFFFMLQTGRCIVKSKADKEVV